MPTVWRIVKRRHLAGAFDGEGASGHGGRWNGRGTRVAYASETRALAVLEVLAGLRATKVLAGYVLVPASFDDALVRALDAADLPADWRAHPPPRSTQAVGDAWVASGGSAVLRVPSVILPDESNFLLNPLHPDFAAVAIGEPEDFAIDPRLLG